MAPLARIERVLDGHLRIQIRGVQATGPRRGARRRAQLLVIKGEIFAHDDRVGLAVALGRDDYDSGVRKRCDESIGPDDEDA